MSTDEVVEMRRRGIRVIRPSRRLGYMKKRGIIAVLKPFEGEESGG